VQPSSERNTGRLDPEVDTLPRCSHAQATTLHSHGRPLGERPCQHEHRHQDLIGDHQVTPETTLLQTLCQRQLKTVPA